MTKRHRKQSNAPRWKPKSARARQPAAAPPPKAVKFYGGVFAADELALIAACLQDPQLDDELWLQRVSNLRLLRVAAGLEQAALSEAEALGSGGAGDAPPADIALKHLVRVTQALTAGAGRVARLLRDRRVLSGEGLDDVAQSLSKALDEFAQLMGVNLTG
ncbi:MAG: hypothetical protein IT317_17170 [Anaerolineales bacterium]|nr:hypothetical protein [Anaerolineales bacterium]